MKYALQVSETGAHSIAHATYATLKYNETTQSVCVANKA